MAPVVSATCLAASSVLPECVKYTITGFMLLSVFVCACILLPHKMAIAMVIAKMDLNVRIKYYFSKHKVRQGRLYRQHKKYG